MVSFLAARRDSGGISCCCAWCTAGKDDSIRHRQQTLSAWRIGTTLGVSAHHGVLKTAASGGPARKDGISYLGILVKS